MNQCLRAYQLSCSVGCSTEEEEEEDEDEEEERGENHSLCVPHVSQILLTLGYLLDERPHKHSKPSFRS